MSDLYTNILINFIPSVTDVIEGDLTYQQDLYIQIKTPIGNRPGINQSIPDIYSFAIIDGKLRLKLLPSDLYFPIGRYEVKYFNNNKKRVPIFSETWVVPRLAEKIISINQREPYTLPEDFYSALSLNPNVPFEIRHNKIVFAEDTDIETFTLIYRPVATRDLLTQHERNV